MQMVWQIDPRLYRKRMDAAHLVNDLIKNIATLSIPEDTSSFISYDGEKIYNASGLLRATSKGQAGEMISLEVQRNNERVTLYIPRGPMGTRLKPSSGAPDSP